MLYTHICIYIYAHTYISKDVVYINVSVCISTYRYMIYIYIEREIWIDHIHIYIRMCGMYMCIYTYNRIQFHETQGNRVFESPSDAQPGVNNLITGLQDCTFARGLKFLNSRAGVLCTEQRPVVVA